MNLRRRMSAMEDATRPLDYPDGPISLTEAVSGKRDEHERRRLGPECVRAAIESIREAFERLMRHDDDFTGGAGCCAVVLN